jgi:hypothetical protein
MLSPERDTVVAAFGLSLPVRSHGGRIMKRMGALLAVALLAASILSGCVIVPVGGWYDDGWYYHHRSSPYAYPYPYPYRRGW